MKSEFKTVLAHLDTKCKHKPLESNMELHGTMYIYINMWKPLIDILEL